MKRNVRMLTLLGAAPLILALVACGGQAAAPTVALAPTTAPTSSPTGTLPVFSDPTNITNPFYPVSLTGQAIPLGTERGQSYRTEVTWLSIGRPITREGGTADVLLVRCVAYAEGQLVGIT